MDNRRKREITLSELSEEEFEKFATIDEYFFEYQHFSVLDYDIKVRNELLAEALNDLTDRRRSVVLLSYFLDMSDTDIARRMNLVRSTVNEHKKISIKMLRKIMEKRTNEKKK
jgi:DNA-directed RNA polymerase specialized sigma24 family protein